jgi:hypothetical protein
MGKLWAIFELFRKGNAVADPVLWKTGGITVALLLPCLLAINHVASSFGIDTHLSEIDAGTIATGLVSIASVVSHLISSDKLGLPPKRKSD